MVSRDKIKSEFDIPVADKRYAGDEHTPLSEIADPTTRQDETSTSVREWAGENQALAGLLTFLGFIALGVMLYLTLKLAPEVLSNPWLHRGLVAAALVGGAYVAATKGTLSRFTQYDWLILTRAGIGTPQFFLGYYVPSDEDRRPLFVPVKGFTFWGHRSEVYTIKEIAPNLAQKREKADLDSSHPGVIRLNSRFGGVAQTWIGRVFVQLSSGLSLDPFAQDSTLKASEPDLADEDALDEFEIELEDQRREIRNLRQSVSRERQRRRQAHEQATMRREEIIEEFVEDHERLLVAHRSQRSGGGETYTPPEDDYSDIEDELAPDQD